MKRLCIVVATLLLLVSAPVSAKSPVVTQHLPADFTLQPDIMIQNHSGDLVAGTRCATVDFGPASSPRAPLDLDAWLQTHGAEKATVNIPVAVHVLYYKKGKTVTGWVPDAQIAAQIDVLNASYAGSGITFSLLSVDRTKDRIWAVMKPGTPAEDRAKEALAVDPAHTLNIYTIAPVEGVLGWALYPWAYPEDHYMHGIVVHYGSLPGGFLYPWDEGDNAVHMTGHYCGLYHTFAGGCSEPNDQCADTPQEESPDFNCSYGRDSCPLDPGLDPIYNFMDYNVDGCVTDFTPDQASRIAWAMATYRPSLWPTKTNDGHDVATVVSPTGITKVSPNPFNPVTDVFFSLRRPGQVSLSVYDLAGRQIDTLLEQELPAGEHQVAFDGSGLPSAVYFVVLEMGGVQSTTRVMLLK